MHSQEEEATPGRRAMIVRSLIALVAGLLLKYRFGHNVGGSIVLCVSGVFALGAAIPAVRRGLHRSEKKLTHAVGSVLTVVLLVPFFYLCIFPGRVFLLLTGKDPLTRKLDPTEGSYWIPIDKTGSREQYRRQS